MRYDLGFCRYVGGEGDMDRYLGGGVVRGDASGVGCRWRTRIAGELCGCSISLRELCR